MLKVMHRCINIRNHLKNTLSSQYVKNSRGELKHSPRLSRIGLLISPGSVCGLILFRLLPRTVLSYKWNINKTGGREYRQFSHPFHKVKSFFLHTRR